LNVDNIYIWNYEYKAIIGRMGIHSNTTVVGPILWYMDDGEKNRKVKMELTLCIFDVTPQSTESLDARGILSSYYNVENASLFISDLVAAVEEVEKHLQRNIRIIMKQKRVPSEKHSQDYDSLLTDLENNNLISILPSHTNLYKLANQSDLSISFPFTSSAYVFSSKGKNSLFYDPTMKIHGKQYVQNNIYFTSGYQQLVSTLKTLLKDL
jgi:polysaccharide biosynthesis PFTS motif protein